MSVSASANQRTGPRRSGSGTGTSSRCCTRSTSRCHRSNCRVTYRIRAYRHSPRLAATGAEAVASSAVPDKALLGRLGLLTNGSLDRTWTTPDGRVHHYRTAGGTGALYHLELYFICTDLVDLPAGIYHYSALDHTLHQIRAGDFRAAITEATGQAPPVAAAPVVLAMTSTFWRNAWRYRERAYRHTFWDAGTSLSHILAVAASRTRRGHARARIRRPVRQRTARCRNNTRVDSRARRVGPHRGQVCDRAHRPAGSITPPSGCPQRR